MLPAETTESPPVAGRHRRVRAHCRASCPARAWAYGLLSGNRWSWRQRKHRELNIGLLGALLRSGGTAQSVKQAPMQPALR